MTRRKTKPSRERVSFGEICGLEEEILEDFEAESEKPVLNILWVEEKQGFSRPVKSCLRGGVLYTYVHPNSYRGAYRFLEKWQQLWGNYERRHPSDETGLPVRIKGPVFVSQQKMHAAGRQVAELPLPLSEMELPDRIRRLAFLPIHGFAEAVTERLGGSLVDSLDK